MKKRWKKGLACALAGALVLGAIPALSGCGKQKQAVASASAAETTRHQSQEELLEGDMPELYFDGDYYRYNRGILSYLFIGTDDSGNDIVAEDEGYRGRMADFLLLMVVDVQRGKYGFLQINRDTITEVERPDNVEGKDLGAMDLQICLSHWYGANEQESNENTELAVCNLLGEMDHLDGYYTLHMSDVDRLNAAVGGVEVTIEDDFTGADPTLVEGETVVLNDTQAQNYVRARMSVGDGENTSRMRRQRTYMKGFLDKAMQKLKADPGFVEDLFDDLEDIADTDISRGDISVIAETMRTGESQGVLQIKGKTKIGETQGDGVKYTEFYANPKSILKQMKKLYTLEYVPEDEED